MVTPWEEPGASIHQRRLQVLSEPCWIVTHHTALQPNLYCLWCRIGGLKALDPLPAPMCTPPRKQAAMLLDPFRIIPHPL